MSNGSSLLWIVVISHNSTSGIILFPFKTLKGMFLPDDFVSSNVEITLRTSLAVTSRKEKGLTIIKEKQSLNWDD